MASLERPGARHTDNRFGFANPSEMVTLIYRAFLVYEHSFLSCRYVKAIQFVFGL